jgi:hypothetical protein
MRISVTCDPLGPGPGTPGGTLPWPLRSATLTCRKASPEPSASSTKPKPLSALYHLTVARTGGPEGLSNCGPRGGAYPKLRVAGSELSSSKLRRRAGRKSLSLLLTARPKRIHRHSRRSTSDRQRARDGAAIADRVIEHNENFARM